MDRTSFLNTYQELRELASGGTGVVYRAYHANLGKYVILKRAKAEMNAAMLRREVDILKNLRHRYLPVIYDYITVDAQAFVVEDYIDGWDLNEYLKRGIQPGEEEVVRWLKQLCEVLDYLHTRSPEIIHSDIKPGNIMVDRRGDICLIDFNISILQGKDKTVLGYSNYYCAPEQREQAEAVLYGNRPERVRIDAQTDIYSLCATFYTLLSGKIPNPRGNNRPLRKMKLPFSEGLCATLDKGMQPSRARRIKSARQMLKMLNHMERMTGHFRRYCALQGALTFVCATMAVVGAVCLLQGSRLEQEQQMSSAIRGVYSSYEQSGGTAQVENDALEVLSTEQPYWEGHHQERAQMLAILAECQFEKDTESGYRNAAEYYAQALEELSQMEPDPEQTDKYALNYAASLYRSGRGDEARSAAEPYLSGQNQEILLAMQAEEAYRQRDDAAVLDYTERIWDRQPDPDILAVVTRLAAHAAKRSERWDDAALWGSRSLEADSRDENRRKVAALMVLAGAERGRSSDFQTAEQVLSGLKEWTQEDCLNLAEILYREGYYTRCVSQLVKLSTSDEALLCRQAYLRAACAVEQEEPENAVEWGEKAARYYKKLTQRQRENVDLDALQDLCRSLGVEEELGR